MESKLRALFLEQQAAERRFETDQELGMLLEGAIARQELAVHYQPQYEMSQGRGCGMEALARWSLPDRDPIPPSLFIPIAERAGSICTLGEWVLLRACEAACNWPDLGGVRPTLSVNVSTYQIDESFYGIIKRVIEATDFPPELLELEITESVLIKDPGPAIDCMEQWKDLGVQIAIDDFGTGYSSLSYLSRLPVDRLKLDRSFVHRMPHERKTAAIVHSVIALGRDMGIGVLAEGIENEMQFDMLEQMGCLQVQGYLFAKPAPAREARALFMTPWGTRSMPGLHPEIIPNRGLHAA